MVDGGGVDGPVALRKLSELHRVVTHGRQAVAAGLPRQQHLAGLDVLLRNHGTAGGLGTSWRDGHTHTHTSGNKETSKDGQTRKKLFIACSHLHELHCTDKEGKKQQQCATLMNEK